MDCRVQTYRDWQYGSFRAPLIALFAAMGLLMLIASANIASLTLANVSARKGEIALRRAIGATGSAVARLIVLEVGMLNLLGAVIGVVIAMGLLPLRNSSFMRSKIRMLASTAIPSDRMKPAMPASVSVTGISLKIASVTSA